MSINYQRRDFMRRALYCGLALGLPKPVLSLADEAPGWTNEGLISLMERALAKTETQMWELFSRCAKDPLKPDIILCGETFFEQHGKALQGAHYERVQVVSVVEYRDD